MTLMRGPLPPYIEKERTWLWRVRMTLDLERTILVGKGTCSNQMSSSVPDFHFLDLSLGKPGKRKEDLDFGVSVLV